MPKLFWVLLTFATVATLGYAFSEYMALNSESKSSADYLCGNINGHTTCTDGNRTWQE